MQCRLHHKSAPQTNILKPFRGTKKSRPDCRQEPRCPCHRITYCDAVCQARHWSVHRLVCPYRGLRVSTSSASRLPICGWCGFRVVCPAEGRFFRYLKAIWPEIPGLIFCQFSAKLGTKIPPDRRGSSCSAGCITNQPRRPIF